MVHRTLDVVKPEIRVLGVDDGRFMPHTKDEVLVVGVVFRGGYWLDGVMHTVLTVDELARMVTSSPHYRQLRVIMLNGITFAGFNIVDIKKLNAVAGLPVIAVTHKKPNLDKVHLALRNLPETEARWEAIQCGGNTFSVHSQQGREGLHGGCWGFRANCYGYC